MSLAEFQRALCDLIASPELCLRVRADPLTSLATYGLTERELRRLESVVRQRGMSTNCTLYRVNRVTPIYSILPLTCELLGERLLPVVTAFWESRATDLQTKHEVDRFADELLARLGDGSVVDPYIREVLLFEQAANSLRFMRRNEILLGLEQAPPTRPAPHPLVRVTRFDHEPMRVLEPLSERRRPPPALATGEHYLLLDARVGYAADLAVAPVEPGLGRPLLAWERGGIPPDEDTLARLDSAGLVVGASSAVAVS